MKSKLIGPWSMTLDGMGAYRAWEGTHADDVRGRVAFIEKTPRVRIREMGLGMAAGKAMDAQSADHLNWASRGYKGEGPDDLESRAWCDEMLKLLYPSAATEGEAPNGPWRSSELAGSLAAKVGIGPEGQVVLTGWDGGPFDATPYVGCWLRVDDGTSNDGVPKGWSVEKAADGGFVVRTETSGVYCSDLDARLSDAHHALAKWAREVLKKQDRSSRQRG